MLRLSIIVFPANSGYIHIVHNHGHGQFGYGDESTSHIENLWAFFK